MFFLILLSEFGECDILLLKSFDLNLQLNQSLSELSRLDLLACGQEHTCKTEKHTTNQLIYDYRHDHFSADTTVE